MQKILHGAWGQLQDTAWEFYLADTFPTDIPTTAVMGVPFWKDKVTLVKTFRGWEIPGGHIEEGESALQCLHRELLEEIGATDITTQKLLGFRKILNPDRKIFGTEGRIYPRATIVPYYLVTLSSQPDGGTAEDSIETGIFALEDPEVQNSHDIDILTIAFSRKADILTKMI